MKKIATYLFLFLLTISSPVLGHFLGRMIGNSMDERRHLSQLNKPWKKIEGSYNFVEIIDANPETLWAKTAEGKLYYLEFNCSESGECVQWVETKDIPSDIHNYGPESAERPLERGKTCPSTGGPYPKPSQKVVECVLNAYMTVVYIGTYYALMDDGTIWYWNVPAGNDSIDAADVYGLLGLVLGFVVSIISGSVLISMIPKTNRK